MMKKGKKHTEYVGGGGKRNDEEKIGGNTITIYCEGI